MTFDLTPPNPTIESVRILHVDDDPPVIDITREFLEREDDRFECTAAETASEALELLDAEAIDCVVSDYEMPDQNGLELLSSVRDRYPDLPFILFTGKGSEEIASEAISAGVTDYLQKGSGSDQYTVLANRIANAVSQRRAEQAVERTRKRFTKLVEYSTDVISVVDADGRWQFLTPSANRVLGVAPEELVGEIGFEHVHPEDREQAMAQFTRAMEDPEWIPSVEFRWEHPEKGTIWLENYARNLVDDPDIQGFVIHTRDITERKRKAEDLKRQNERLDEFASVVSHDLRNPLNVATGELELAREDCDSPHLENAAASLSRMETIIERTLTLAKSGQTVGDPEPCDLRGLAESSWRNVDTGTAELAVVDSVTIAGDPDRLKVFFENLFRNAVEHADDTVTVRVGTLPDEEGFYVADDGPGIPAEDRDAVLESGVSTNQDGSGLGLTICQHIVVAHDWELAVTESQAGGARFEVTGLNAQ